MDVDEDIIVREMNEEDAEKLDILLVIHMDPIDVDNEVLYGTIEIPLTEQMYPAAAVVWKGLKEITHNCKFYKQQSSGEKILLATA